MGLTRQSIEALAPDQAALKAASGLLKPAKWPLRAQNETGSLIWGECQGSGANPYRVMADTQDIGSKCTCPSRKFPCKHAIALMWMHVDDAKAFAKAEVPEWVTDWLGRRRGSSGNPKPSEAYDKPYGEKSLAAAEAEEAPKVVDEKAEARKKAQAEKRAEATQRSLGDAADDLEQWVADQLRTGLGGFLAELVDRCRRIAARLVDARAGALASRIDEMPARILALPAEERPDAAIAELGKLVLLVRAWRAEPNDPELKREMASTETRDQVLADAGALRVRSTWEAVGLRVTTRRDGLVSQSTWLMNLGEGQRFALLQDFYPASGGRRTNAFSPAEQFNAELAFYPAHGPLRAVIASREPETPGARPWPQGPEDLLSPWAEALHASPWRLEAPVILPAGRVARDGHGRAWWRADDASAALPLGDEIEDVTLGMHLRHAVAVWSGARAHLLSAQSDWGRISFDG